MPARQTIADMISLAASRGGRCLSRTYTNARLPLLWRCAHGHKWSATPSNVRNHGSWCPMCAGVKRHVIEEMRKHAIKKNGACLSAEYVGINGKLRWRCACAYEWEATPKSVLGGTWCPKCAGNLRGDLAKMSKLAARRGGQCLATAYLGDAVKLTWCCASGHSFKASPSNVNKGKWCPTCSTPLGERLTRWAFEQLFGHQFPRMWPSWLKSGKGAPMELDGYCEPLRLAFEHQGEPHYKELRHFHRLPGDFEAQLQRDKMKRRLCAENGVALIVVPQVPSRTRIPALARFITDAVKAAKPSIVVALPPEEVKFDEVYRTDGVMIELARLQQVAASRNGQLVSTHYAGRHVPLEWECAAQHRWGARPANILQGKWCPHCARCSKLTVGHLHAAAAEHGGTCLSPMYQNSQMKVRWRCAQGHEFEAALATVRGGHWCAQCKGVKRYDIEFIRSIAAGKGGVYLSSAYEGMNALASWRCEEGHEFVMSPSAVKNRGRWCPVCKGTSSVLARCLPRVHEGRSTP